MHEELKNVIMDSYWLYLRGIVLRFLLLIINTSLFLQDFYYSLSLIFRECCGGDNWPPNHPGVVALI